MAVSQSQNDLFFFIKLKIKRANCEWNPSKCHKLAMREKKIRKKKRTASRLTSIPVQWQRIRNKNNNNLKGIQKGTKKGHSCQYDKKSKDTERTMSGYIWF